MFPLIFVPEGNYDLTTAGFQRRFGGQAGAFYSIGRELAEE